MTNESCNIISGKVHFGLKYEKPHMSQSSVIVIDETIDNRATIGWYWSGVLMERAGKVSIQPLEPSVSPRMARLALLLASLLPLATSQFVPPEVILQAGYPAGFRAFIPDFPGCQQFAFHGKINSPFTEVNELGSIFQEILRPQDGFWIMQDFKLILNPGDIIHYWTNVVKDGVAYPKHNQTWNVPGPEGSVDILSPIKPPKKTPEKVKKTTPPTDKYTPRSNTPKDQTTPKINTPSTSSDETASTNSDATAPTSMDEITPSNSETSTPSLTITDTETTPQTPPSTKELNPTTVQTTPSTKETSPTTTQTPSSSMKSTTTTILTTPSKTTVTSTTTKKIPTSEKRETQNPKISENSEKEVEELTTPFPSERPLSSEFPEEPPLFPFPGLYPQPFKPMMPSQGPGFEICSNPWNFEERISETRTQKLERQVAKLQCQLALFQRGYNQLSNTVESELTDLKKLMYGMVSRMANLESVLRSTPFG